MVHVCPRAHKFDESPVHHYIPMQAVYMAMECLFLPTLPLHSTSIAIQLGMSFKNVLDVWRLFSLSLAFLFFFFFFSMAWNIIPRSNFRYYGCSECVFFRILLFDGISFPLSPFVSSSVFSITEGYQGNSGQLSSEKASSRSQSVAVHYYSWLGFVFFCIPLLLEEISFPFFSFYLCIDGF